MLAVATKRDIELASLLFRSGILNQEEIQGALAHQGKLLTEGKVVPFLDLLVERSLIPADAAPTFTEEPLEKLQPLPDYEIQEFIGDGASARVYKGLRGFPLTQFASCARRSSCARSSTGTS